MGLWRFGVFQDRPDWGPDHARAAPDRPPPVRHHPVGVRDQHLDHLAVRRDRAWPDPVRSARRDRRLSRRWRTACAICASAPAIARWSIRGSSAICGPPARRKCGNARPRASIRSQRRRTRAGSLRGRDRRHARLAARHGRRDAAPELPSGPRRDRSPMVPHSGECGISSGEHVQTGGAGHARPLPVRQPARPPSCPAPLP